MRYSQIISEKWGEWIFRDVIDTVDFSRGLSLKDDHRKMAKQLRSVPRM